MILTGEPEELGEKPVSVPLCPKQVPHGLNRMRTLASEVRGRRVTASVMARPKHARRSCMVSWTTWHFSK
jgi:hypothetical protein